jgi:membrane-bound lytic murein transglycosylase A
MRTYFLLPLLLLAACAGPQGDPMKLALTPASYQEIPGWQQDAPQDALRVFAESCARNGVRGNYFTTRTELAYRTAEDWRRVCDAAMHGDAATDARRFFETQFTPFRAVTETSDTGLTTGYYEPLLHGSPIRDARHTVPVYGMPYEATPEMPARAEIDAGALDRRAPVLLYVDDPVMLFFLHIQGSGKVQMNDGRLVSLQYAGQNGHSYFPIGRVLKERGELETVTMQTIRDWLRANPDRAAEVMHQNPSYVFFRLLDGQEYAKGALGVPLTPERSIAVDDERVPYGLPVFLATEVQTPDGMVYPYRRLMVAQDTGGAIIGPIRYDIFFGRGEQAEWLAGTQNTPAEVFWLLPNTGPLHAEAAR